MEMTVAKTAMFSSRLAKLAHTLAKSIILGATMKETLNDSAFCPGFTEHDADARLDPSVTWS